MTAEVWTREAALRTHLLEYEKVSDELFGRWENQRHSFNFVIAVLVGLGGLASADGVDLQPQLFFWLPLVIAPMGYVFFDNELMIWGIVNYIGRDLRAYSAYHRGRSGTRPELEPFPARHDEELSASPLARTVVALRHSHSVGDCIRCP
ncbi:hypothetical protein [Nocardioides xinjiangensis]|uniref:hypothetical protein n=1 Tax=Nocardioides xinjiangensis TaxID=2817376 RepID=UPI001B300ECA|nr:hypothetical protein [Nocardioides sp. SYSU D00514]